jgi:protein gp37
MGVSVTCQEDIWRIDELVHNSPLPGGSYLFVSFEPLHGPIEADLTGTGWVICGAESGNRKGKIIPELEWVKKIARDANHLGISVFIKNNLQELYRQQPGCLGGVQEFPEAMKR